MSKSNRRLDNKQISIFDHLKALSEKEPTTEGQFDVAARIRSEMRTAIKNCPLSVYQIAGEMSHLVGASITADQIYSWTRDRDQEVAPTGEKKFRHIPAEYLGAFCQVTGSWNPLRVIGKPGGIYVLPGGEAMRAEIKKLEEKAEELKAQIRKRKLFLKELEADGNERWRK
jgi:hypothetical protein